MGRRKVNVDVADMRTESNGQSECYKPARLSSRRGEGVAGDSQSDAAREMNLSLHSNTCRSIHHPDCASRVRGSIPAAWYHCDGSAET